MALIKCPDCGREVSDSTPSCPNCTQKYKRLDYQRIDAVRLLTGDAIYVNDEGMLFADEELAKRGFFIRDMGK